MADKMEDVEMTPAKVDDGPTAQKLTDGMFQPPFERASLTGDSSHLARISPLSSSFTIRRTFHPTSTQIDIKHPEEPTLSRSSISSNLVAVHQEI